MAVDGTWTLVMQTPIGERQANLTVSTAGGSLSGTQSADGDTGTIYEGTVAGDQLSWKVDITNPLPMTLEFSGTVSGASMSGNMSAGMYGSWPFTGTRA